MIIREIRESDAENFLDMQKKIEEESQFMLLEPGEREDAVAAKRKLIRKVLARDNETVLVVENSNGSLAGYLRALGGSYQKTRHSAYITVGILKKYTGKGLGTRLFTELEVWARKNGIHRLELIVVKKHEAAVGLYKKMGYEIEGTKRDSLLIDGEYVDEYYMGKLLD